MKRTVLFGSCVILALATAGCQDQTTEPARPSVTHDAQLSLKSLQAQGYGLSRSRVRLPAGPLSERYLAEALRRAINPGDYVCPPSTPLIDWLLAEIDRIDPDVFDLLYNQLLADLIPAYEALLFETADTPQYFGYNGEYTQVMLKTEKDVKRFWDTFSSDIQLLAMHGTVLTDIEKVAATYQALFVNDDGTPLSPEFAEFLATLVHDAVLSDPALDGGNHPLFTFNAFAFSDFDGPIPDKIVMGDGILAGYSALGFDDVAPQGVYAHEFAHHIQYENGYFEEFPPTGATTQAELTRYTELMADAMSAYYLTHKRGAALNRKRVAQFLEVFFNIGDCAFTNPGHHGTPNQRLRAAEFGFNVADAAQKQGHILTSDEFHDRFVAEYSRIVAPDAT